jgi:phosphoribosyl-ATP pyrophosphohydrolase
MGERTKNVVDGNLGQTLATLRETIHSRATERPAGSYTVRLLEAGEDLALKKVMEEAGEVALAAKDNDHDHIRYESADLVYHLLVVLERYGITNEELAGELNARHR